jgi:AcrR family transcriptional regulator
MVTMTFQRARSEEQREARRQAILGTASAMLAEMPVAELSLNELSRRVGLAKSNVLRYFESREAVLLDLLAAEWTAFTAQLAARLPGRTDGSLTERGQRLAAAITETLVAHPRLCELMSASAAVLERNISTEVARDYKASALANMVELSAVTTRVIPELSTEGAMNFALSAAVCASGLWPLAHPSDELVKVYEDPAFAPLRMDFQDGLRDMLETVLAGCLARWPALSV